MPSAPSLPHGASPPSPDDGPTMAARLTQTEAQLERARAELNQLAYAVSHDLREPLRSIGGFLNLLVRQHGDHLDDKGRHYIDRVQAAAGRLERMIDHLVDYSRIVTRARPSQTVAGGAILDQALFPLQDAIGKTGACIATEALPDLFGDPAQLARLFQELIANALTFQPAGASPRVQISGRLETDARTGATLARITVRDNGIGIAPENGERVFQVFQRLHTEAEYPGAGMGLALCRRIVERHHGRIWLESSEPAQGTTFALTLPTGDSPTPTDPGPDVPKEI